MAKENGLYNHHITFRVSDSAGRRAYCEVIITSYSKILDEATLIDVRKQAIKDFKERYHIKDSLESVTVVIIAYVITK